MRTAILSRRRLTAAAFLLATRAAFPQAATYDVILRGGTVVDGTGAKGYAADVAVRGGFIHRVGNLGNAKAKVELDARGLVVAPGFLNLHSHASPEGLPTAVNMLTQGVTTEIVNADGSGTIAIARQLEDFARGGLAVNLGAYAGFNAIWTSVMGQADRRPSPAEIEKMRGLLTANLKQGAWGVAAGLDYKPAYFARADEVAAVLQASSAWRTNFPNHDRLTPETKYSSLAGIAETIEIGEKSNLMPVITHMKVQGREQGSAQKAIALMRSASARGHETVADIYPYLAGLTGLGALFVPAWATAGGRDEMLKRFRDPEQRPRIAREIEEAINARVLTPENIDIPPKQRKLTDFMRDMNAGAGESLIRILETEHPWAILKFGAEEDLIALLRFPGSAVSCDCGAAPPGQESHPRAYGTFPRVLGHYVRETKVLTLEDAVRKMTGLPASIAGMTGRGFLAAGMAADIVAFDPAAIADRATYSQPALPSEGVRHVLVNGRIALRDGVATGEKAGLVLSRDANMPSRPMRLDQPRSVSVTSGNVSLKASQTSGGPARASLRFSDAAAKTEIRLTAAGLLQTHKNWASLTGLARLGPESAEHAALVIVDGPNPASPASAIVIHLDDGRRFEMPLREKEIRVRAPR